MTEVFLDIETIPTQNEEIKQKIVEGVKAPSNYKDPKKIAQYKKDNAQSAIDKTSFDGGRGHVCTIAWAKGSEGVKSAHAKTIVDERHILDDFFADLPLYHSTIIVGHHVGPFDIRFLTQRAIFLGVKLPPVMSWPRNPKPWSDKVFDTMTAWAGDKGTIGLDTLCDILGIEGKGDFDGTMVAQAWLDGDHDKIQIYCEDDVRRVRDVYNRFKLVGF